MALASLGREIQDLSKKLGLSPDLMILERAWNQEAGSMSAMARIAALDRGTLVIDADSHVVMQEISLRRRELVRR